MSIVWFCLIAYGLTQIIVFGKIFEPIRPTTGWFGQLFRCPMCTGFWVGLFLWFVKDYTQLFNFDDSFITAICLGAASSAAAYIGTMLICDEGLKIYKFVTVEKERNQTNDN